MNAKLVYIVDDKEIILEEKTLNEIDFFTFKNFDCEEDIIKSELYSEKLKDVSKEGKVVLQYLPFDIEVNMVDFYGSLGGNPFSKQHELDVWYRKSKFSPSEVGIISSVRNELDTFEKVDLLREDCYDFFQPLDVVKYGYSAMVCDRDVCLEVLESVFDRQCNNSSRHFFRRMICARAKEISTMIDNKKENKYL